MHSTLESPIGLLGITLYPIAEFRDAPTIHLEEGENLFGTTHLCTHSLEKTPLEGELCQIDWFHDNVTIEKIHPDCPLALNGEAVRKAELQDGDVVQLGYISYHSVFKHPVAEVHANAPEMLVCDEWYLQSSFMQDPSHDTTGMCQQPIFQSVPVSANRVEHLLQAGLLTSFQADWLLSGRFTPIPIDEYVILDVLGTGGMSWVYHGFDSTSGRTVALKIVPTQMPRDILTRLELEAKAGVYLNHKHLIRTFDFQKRRDYWYLAMEYVEGVNLFEYITHSGPLPWEVVCDIGCQVADALDHIHRQGLVHRDVKPSNIMIDSQGYVRLLDFGLAMQQNRFQDDEFSLAMIFGQHCIGTPDYMAPEQSHDSMSVDWKADIYSLGCTMFFAMTGSPPFLSQSYVDTFEGHRNEPLPVELLGESNVSQKIKKCLLLMTEKDPKARRISASRLKNYMLPKAKRRPISIPLQEIMDFRKKEARRRISRMIPPLSPDSEYSELPSATQDEEEQLSEFRLRQLVSERVEELSSVTLTPPSSVELESMDSLVTANPFPEVILNQWGTLPRSVQDQILLLVDSQSQRTQQFQEYSEE